MKIKRTALCKGQIQAGPNPGPACIGQVKITQKEARPRQDGLLKFVKRVDAE
ncbi:hypothetical protein [Spirosoma humi]